MSFDLKRDIKTLILIPALFLSYDFLEAWMIIVFGTLLLGISFFKLPKFIAYLNFASSYFIFKTVGFFIIPETMVPNLSVFVISQFLLNKKRDVNEFYLVFLWLGTYALFSSSFYYLVYSFVALLVVFIIDETNSNLSLKSFFISLWRYKKQFSLISVITIILFIFFPRVYQFLPTANFIPQGKIGYSEEVNNSTTANLQLSSQVAFYAELETILPTDALYWRGRVLSKTDGYNWSKVQSPIQQIDYKSTTKEIKQRLKYEQNFNGDIVLLNTPLKIIDSNAGIYSNQVEFTYSTYFKKKKSTVEAVSSLNPLEGISLRPSSLEHYTQLPGFIPQEVKELNEQLAIKNAQDLVTKFRTYVVRENFQYTLSPGPLATMNDFIRAKKGYCSHFASLMAVLFRINKIPARLVSGFQGGEYNDIGKFYTIKSNDAHVWVEYFSDGKWTNIDPTSFVSPDRVNLGGNQYLSAGISLQEQEKQNILFKPLYRVKGFFDSLNFKVSLFLDNYDRGKQKSLSKYLNISRKAFYAIGVAILLLVIAAIFLLNPKRFFKKVHPADKILIKTGKKLQLSQFKTIKELKSQSQHFSDPQKYLEFIQAYQEVRYGYSQDLEQLRALASHLTVVKVKS